MYIKALQVYISIPIGFEKILYYSALTEHVHPHMDNIKFHIMYNNLVASMQVS